MASPVTDFYSCGPGETIVAGSSGDAVVSLKGKYRTDQDRLFIDVPPSVVTVDNGTYAVTEVSASLADPTTDWMWSYFGPSYDSVDKLSEWKWTNPGGDWIDRTGTPQGTAQPHFTFAANAVTSGAHTYSVDFTYGAQASQAGSRWNAYIVKLTGGSRSISALHGSANLVPKLNISYADGTSGILKCTACVRLTVGTAYGQIGRAKAEINQSVALEFERPRKAVASATLTITILDHTATASTISGYLANPATNAGSVVSGLAVDYPLDSGITANPNVIFAHDYHDGTAWSDWVAPTPGLNVFTTANWSPHLFGLGGTDTTKLPYQYAGTNVQGKWIEKNVVSSLGVVNSSYAGEGFQPLAPGLGAIRSITPGYTGVDGGVVAGAGATGSSLWMLLPEAEIGLLSRMFVRYYMRLGTTEIKKLKDTKTVRNGSSSASATHAQAIGKCGIGQMHWTNFGGNNNIGGGNIGWTNRLVYQEMLKDVETAGLVVGQHSWDMTSYNMGYGQQGGMGGSMYQGQWYCVELDLQLNTVDPGGVNNLDDAVLNVYIDGILVCTRTNFSYRKLPLDYRAISFSSNYNSTTRMGPTNPDAGLPPFREIGHMGICLNDYNGGVLPADHDRVVFYSGLVVSKSYVGPMNMSTSAAWAPAPGEIKNISTNTLADINPRNDSLANPNYPGAAPWEYAPWTSVTDFGGAVFADNVGTHGTLMVWGDAGHSAVSASCWSGFDLATRQWKRIGNRPLPSDGLRKVRDAGVAADAAHLAIYYPATQLDTTWGDWKGDYSGWPTGFAQPGYNPPAAGHNHKGAFYLPPAKAGNTSGKVVTCWQPTGVNTGTGIRGGHVWDADTGLWSRQNSLRPAYYANGTGAVYFPTLDVAVASLSDSAYLSTMHVLDTVTMTWATRTCTNAPYIDYTSVGFAHGELLIVSNNKQSVTTPPLTLHAIDAAAVKAGSGAAWTNLTVSASSYPVNGSGLATSVCWALCPVNGCYYAVNRVHGSNKIWKLTPPTGTTKASQLSGTWTITEETMTTGTLDGRISSGASGTSFDYGRLAWSDYAHAFLWYPDFVGGNVQAIRPLGT